MDRGGPALVSVYPKLRYMKKTNIKNTALLSVLALGLSIPVFAQNAPQTQAADPGPGLVGSNYSEVSFGYQKQGGSPKSLRDYGFVSNGSIFRQDAYGLDANFRYDYLSGAAYGQSDRRNQALLGVTGYLLETWGKPFVTVDAGYAWQDVAGVSRRSFAYTASTGIEFQLLKNLALTPFVEYQAEPHLYNRGLPLTNWPDRDTYYGLKATYRITREWGASVGVDLDRHSTNDFGVKAGLSYRF